MFRKNLGVTILAVKMIRNFDPIVIAPENIRAVVQSKRFDPEDFSLYLPSWISFSELLELSPSGGWGTRLFFKKRDGDPLQHLTIEERRPGFGQTGLVSRHIEFLGTVQSEELAMALQLFYLFLQSKLSIWLSLPIVQETLGTKEFCVSSDFAQELMKMWCTAKSEPQFRPLLKLPSSDQINSVVADLLPHPQKIQTSLTQIEWTQDSSGFHIRKYKERGEVECSYSFKKIELARAGLVELVLLGPGLQPFQSCK